jgi:hypothetical protein
MGEVKRSANSFYTYMIILITVPRIGGETLVNKGETHFRPLVPVGLEIGYPRDSSNWMPMITSKVPNTLRKTTSGRCWAQSPPK